MSGHGTGWANPSPAGLVALALALVLFYAVIGGHVEGTAAPLVGLWLLGGFVVQIIVALIELKEGAFVGGNVFTIFAAFFMLTGAASFYFKYFAGINGWPLDTTVDGYAWAVLTVTLIIFTPAYFKTTPAAFNILFLLMDIGLVILTLMDLHIISHHPWASIFSNMCLVNTCLTLYIVAAIVINSTFAKVILPMGAPFIKAKPETSNIAS